MLPTTTFEFVPFRLESSAEIKTQDPIYSVRDFWTKDWKTRPEGSVVRSIAADLDRDGKPERIEVSNKSNSIRVVWNDGRTTEVVDCSAPVVDLTVLDFDGDGYSDLAALEWKAGLRLVRNNGRRGFEDVTSASGLRTNVTEAFAVASLDYDRDGRPDLLLAPYPPYVQVLLRFAHPTAEPSPYSLRLFRNVGEGHFLEVQGIPGLAEIHGVMRAIPADFDRDGFTDILLACGGLDNFRLEPSVVLRNEQGKAFAIHAYLPSFDNPLRALGAEVRDLDGDGNPDIRLRTPDGIRAFRNVHR